MKSVGVLFTLKSSFCMEDAVLSAQGRENIVGNTDHCNTCECIGALAGVSH